MYQYNSVVYVMMTVDTKLSAEGLGNLKPIFSGDETVLNIFAVRVDISMVREYPLRGLRHGFVQAFLFVHANVAATKMVQTAATPEAFSWLPVRFPSQDSGGERKESCRSGNSCSIILLKKSAIVSLPLGNRCAHKESARALPPRKSPSKNDTFAR